MTILSIVLERDEAARVIQEMQVLGPHVKLEIQRLDNGLTLRAQTDQSELLQWAERVGNRYQDVFEKLAKS